jgi:hypothetical protein
MQKAHSFFEYLMKVDIENRGYVWLINMTDVALVPYYIFIREDNNKNIKGYHESKQISS